MLWGKVGQSGGRDVAVTFAGEFEHSVDAKGRLALPARFRAKIERGAVLTRGIEPCLYVFPTETWEQKGQELAETAIDPRQRRMIERRFFGMAFECELDGQGRIVVPAKFRQYAGLNGEAVVIGARDRIEIWSAERWEAYTAEMQEEDLTGLPLPF
jgi:MraZ protein